MMNDELRRDFKSQLTLIPSECRKVFVGPGVRCDLMTSVVREFDTVDFIWVVNTAP